MSANEVVVYTKTECVYCKRLKQWLKLNNYAYEELNIEEDEDARAYVKAHGNLEDGVVKMPQVRINGDFISHQPYSNLEPYLNK